jgi:hypothetical protein
MVETQVSKFILSVQELSFQIGDKENQIKDLRKLLNEQVELNKLMKEEIGLLKKNSVVTHKNQQMKSVDTVHVKAGVSTRTTTPIPHADPIINQGGGGFGKGMNMVSQAGDISQGVMENGDKKKKNQIVFPSEKVCKSCKVVKSKDLFSFNQMKKVQIVRSVLNSDILQNQLFLLNQFLNNLLKQ